MVSIKYPSSLSEYLTKYGKVLGTQTQSNMRPLHRPGVDPLIKPVLKRSPFEPQSHVITAGVRQLNRDDLLIVVGECGTGKTIMGMAIAHAHAKGKPYRGLVMVPPQLTNKWEREVRDTIPGVIIRHISKFGDLIRYNTYDKPKGAEWYVISETSAKMGAEWEAAYDSRSVVNGAQVPSGKLAFCPRCGGQVVKHNGPDPKPPIELEKLSRTRHRCEHVVEHFTADGRVSKAKCDEPLWSYNGNTKKWAPAIFISRKMRHFFDYYIPDEVHELNSKSSARGEAMGMLGACIKKKIALTGTLFGGYAWHVFAILMRLAPASLIRDGITWSEASKFDARYGRIRTRITETKPGDRGSDNRQSKGSNRRVVDKSPEPGILPTLFGKHLIDKCVFLSLSDLSDCLPPFDEKVVAIDMDRETAKEYERIEDDLRQEVRTLMRQKNMALLSAMLHTLLDYADYPFDWDWVGYWKNESDGQPKRFIKVVKPKDLGRKEVRPKERALLDFVKSERKAKRQVWIYVNSTDTRDVAARLDGLLKSQGFAGTILRAEKVGTKKREEWIAKTAPGLDYIISHPKPVRTGLDLFCKRGAYNFVSLYFYQTGYDLFTLRQAARRSWRIGQTQICKVRYAFYSGTMQDRAMTHMGRKLAASEMIEGNSDRISEEGLAALTGGDSSGIELELARSLVDNLQDLGAERSWSKITANPTGNAAMIGAEVPIVEECLDDEESGPCDAQEPIAIVPEDMFATTPATKAGDYVVSQLSLFGGVIEPAKGRRRR